MIKDGWSVHVDAIVYRMLKTGDDMHQAIYDVCRSNVSAREWWRGMGTMQRLAVHDDVRRRINDLTRDKLKGCSNG